MEWRAMIGWIFLVTHSVGARGTNGSSHLPSRIGGKKMDIQNNFIQAGIGSYLRDIFRKFPDEGSLEEGLMPNVSDHCIGHTLEWISQLRRVVDSRAPELWALHMFDAFGKFPEGILSGHINPLGDYDECVGIQAKDVMFNQSIQELFPDLPTSFRGFYCNVKLTPVPREDGDREPAPGSRPEADLSRESVSPIELLRLMAITEGIFVIPSWAMCLPSSCSVQDVGNLTVNLLTLMNLDDVLRPFPAPVCRTGIKPDLDTADISVIVLLGTLVGICLFAGAVDMWMNRGEGKRSKPGLALQYLLAFSAYTNIRKWVNTRTSGDDLGCIHGIRVLSTSWVVLGHTWYMILFMPSWNMVDVKNIHEDWTILTVLNSSISVDTFFVMSGMLVAFNLLKLLEKSKGKLNLPMFYIHRFLRITPTYALLVGIMATILPHLGSGPFWGVIENWSLICEDNWWNNLLYINNFLNTDRLCQGEAWYLACDMQFYILSPLFIYPLWRWKKFGLGLLLVSTIASILCPAMVVYFMEVTAATSISLRAQPTYFDDLYIKPHTRIQTYLVGIALGYLLFVKRGQKVHIPKIVLLIGWVGATSTALAVLYGIYPWFNPETEIDLLAGTLYGGLHRFAWGVSVSWVIFTCVKGYGGLVNDFLSWKVFIPLGRLCFCVYLANFFLAHLMMSFMVGFLCTLTLESPFIIVQKLIFEGPTKPRVPKSPEIHRPTERNGIFYQTQEMSIETEKKIQTVL